MFLTLYYSAWITNGSFRLLRPMKYGLVFNNMLEHLLRWEFDVDPGLIEGEGFVHDGKAYAYFGILPALLRFPLLLAGRLEDVNVTILSCVLAAGISVFFKLAAIATISRAVSDRGSLYAVWLSVALAIALGGPELQFLDASIYQEVVNWAGALGSVFVYLAIRELPGAAQFSAFRADRHGGDRRSRNDHADIDRDRAVPRAGAPHAAPRMAASVGRLGDERPGGRGHRRRPVRARGVGDTGHSFPHWRSCSPSASRPAW